VGPALMGYMSRHTHSFKSAFTFLLIALLVAGCLTLAVRVRRPGSESMLGPPGPDLAG
jgi:cyanate permease